MSVTGNKLLEKCLPKVTPQVGGPEGKESRSLGHRAVFPLLYIP